jgi:hypothetical protein
VADYTPIFAGGARPRFFTAGGTITGGQVVAVSAANTVVAAGAASTAVVGVAGHDVANGGQLTVWPLPGVTHEVVSSAAIAVGDNLAAAAAGQVAPIAAGSFGQLLGVATTAAGAGGIKVEMVGR